MSKTNSTPAKKSNKAKKVAATPVASATMKSAAIVDVSATAPKADLAVALDKAAKMAEGKATFSVAVKEHMAGTHGTKRRRWRRTKS